MGGPTYANHDIVGSDGADAGGHDTEYWSNGAPAGPYRGWRGTVIIDRLGSGNEYAHAGLVEFINSFNNDTGRRGLQGSVPYLGYARDDASAGACAPNAQPVVNGTARNFQIPGWSWTLICQGSPVGSIGLASVYGTGTHYGGAGGLMPWMYADLGRIPNQCGARSVFTQEISHTLGLGHRTGTSVMNTTMGGNACRWFDEHDFDALRAKYNHTDLS